MRETRPFSQALLLAAFICLLLGVLLPWWSAYRTLAEQQLQLHRQLPALLAADRPQAELPGVAEWSRERPLDSTTPAWWFGKAAAGQQLMLEQTPVFYRLDSRPATRLWLMSSVPLTLVNLLLFTGLYRRWRRESREREQYFQTLLLDPEQGQLGGRDPVEQGIIGLHQRYREQLDELQRQLSEAHQQSHQDSLTALGNRYAFRRDLTLMLTDENKLATATLMIVRASSLQNINSRLGFQAGDQYLQDIARLVRKVIQPQLGARAYRISGTDIAVLAKGQCEPLAQSLGTQLQQALHHYQHVHELDCAAYIGFTQLLPGQSPETVLIRADSALAQAQGGEPNGWRMVLRHNDDEDMGESQWRQRLQSMLEQDGIQLMVQPARLLKPAMPGYNEIFSHFPNGKGGSYPATTVFAMLQRLDMSMLFEQKIIETTLRQIASRDMPAQRWAINLTPASLQQNSFLIWLERVLLRDVNITSCLVFELDEHVLEHQLVAGKRLLDMIRRCGARSAVSKFGHGYGSFRLLKELKPDYIKLDAQLVRHLEDDSANQQFVRMIIDLAQRLGCHVVAEGVETDAQKQLLETMYIDGIQGYLISKPLPLAEFKGLALSV
ncbi:GGDEF domain-containing protein [Zobellella taiwanensis]|uniref:GGDEF domain-containing protein n=1 Tax=Zobellella taiwanensis TaxID=347535 RepID=A0A2P7QJP8_9GAMM|nr:GGDEF domain-containing protein [Zobellella taiwanensis]PSJ38170.1 GGDEF domain-containing protein [Zobellella taiwanensis]